MVAIMGTKDTTVSFNGQAIGGLISFSYRDGEAIDKDRTVLSSQAKESAPGLPENGNMTMQVFVDASDPGQAACLTALDAQAVETVIVTYPDLSTETFSAYVKSMPRDVGPDSDVKGSIKLKITGAIT